MLVILYFIFMLPLQTSNKMVWQTMQLAISVLLVQNDASLLNCFYYISSSKINMYHLLILYVCIVTLRPVFSMTTYLPSAAHSGIETGPLALRWYVVLADISPLTTVADETVSTQLTVAFNDM